MQSHQKYSCFVLGVVAMLISISSVNGAAPVTPTFKADRQYVQEGTTKLQYDCTGFKYTKTSNVIFYSNNEPLFASLTNKTGKKGFLNINKIL